MNQSTIVWVAWAWLLGRAATALPEHGLRGPGPPQRADFRVRRHHPGGLRVHGVSLSLARSEEKRAEGTVCLSYDERSEKGWCILFARFGLEWLTDNQDRPEPQ